jgi:hypothetical protein
MAAEVLHLHKLMAGRLIDRADVAALLRSNHASLDFTYLSHWLNDNKLTADFAGIWSETLPEKPLPIDP